MQLIAQMCFTMNRNVVLYMCKVIKEKEVQKMKEYTIYPGKKLSGLVDNQASVSFECDPNDIDTAYDAIAENVVLKDQSEDSQDLIDFENCADDDVKTMLEDLKRMQFLSDYDEEEADD